MLAMKQIRERLGMTQVAVARELGVSRQAYNQWELGKRQADYEYLLRLAELFDTTVENILTGCLENAKPLTETQERLAALAEAGDPSPQVRMLMGLPEKQKSPREFATREDAIKYYQQDLTEEEFKELEMFADFLRYRRGHQP